MTSKLVDDSTPGTVIMSSHKLFFYYFRILNLHTALTLANFSKNFSSLTPVL